MAAMDLGLRDFGHGQLPAAMWKGVLRTPAIQRQSDATALQANLRIRAKSDSVAPSCKIAVGDFQVRKAIL